MYIENSVVLSVIVPLLVNVPAVVPLPSHNPLLPLNVPVPPLFNVKLPSSVPPPAVKLLVLAPAAPSRIPPVRLRFGTAVVVSRLSCPPLTSTVPAPLTVPVVIVAVPPAKSNVAPEERLNTPVSVALSPVLTSDRVTLLTLTVPLLLKVGYTLIVFPVPGLAVKVPLLLKTDVASVV